MTTKRTIRHLAGTALLATALAGSAWATSSGDQADRKTPAGNGVGIGGEIAEVDQQFTGDYGSGNAVKDKRVRENDGYGTGNFLPPAPEGQKKPKRNGDAGSGNGTGTGAGSGGDAGGSGSGSGMGAAPGDGIGCAADLNRDGAIDWADLLAVLSHYGTRGSSHGSGAGNPDVDRSGLVDFEDMLAILASYGSCG